MGNLLSLTARMAKERGFVSWTPSLMTHLKRRSFVIVVMDERDHTTE